MLFGDEKPGMAAIVDGDYRPIGNGVRCASIRCVYFNRMMAEAIIRSLLLMQVENQWYYSCQMHQLP